MNTFTSRRCDGAASIDPRKRVHYTQGMVLGVDDFLQESAYHRRQNHGLARETVGYGTSSGLAVSIRDRGKGPEARVTSGTAIDPCGRWICVDRDQCALVNDWLAAHDASLRNAGWAPGGTVSAYVLLRHRECLTDRAPVPGEPCRCEDHAMVESRVLDDFCLELSPDAPIRWEEEAIRDLTEWLRAIPTTANPAAASSVQAFIDALRAAFENFGSPPASPLDFFHGSPPGGLAFLESRIPEYWRAAFRLWVTEFRPRWHIACGAEPCGGGGGCGCAGDSGSNNAASRSHPNAVLLAELRLTLQPGANLRAAAVVVDESHRPIVLNARMAQEWLLMAGLI